jgi:hypothetical protein
LLFAAVSSQPASAAGDNPPNSTQPVMSEPDDTPTGDTTPDDTEPDETTPEDTTPGDGTTAGADGGADGQDVTALTWLAVLGTLALVGVAAWWMVRHGEADRRVGRMDDDWPGESDVI